MGSERKWGESETKALMEFYPRHGANWDGWAEVLPKRSKMSIVTKASQMGLRSKRRESMSVYTSEERAVLSMLADGMTPTQIDAKMHWRPNTARSHAVSAWLADKERFERK